MTKMVLSPAVEQHRQALLEAVLKAHQRSDPRHSHLSVGAAILTAQGEVFTGCNWESPRLECLGKSHHAEQSALSHMIAVRGPQKVIAVALAGGDLKTRMACTPCGNCREHLITYAELDTPVFVITENAEILDVHRLGDLIPARSGKYSAQDHGPVRSITEEEKKIFDRLTSLISHAYVPYSKEPVAVAIETWDGDVFYGVSREDAAYAGFSATHNALGAMVLGAGPKALVKKAYYGEHSAGSDHVFMPTGPDRQSLREHARSTDTLIVVSSTGTGAVQHVLATLLPHDFGPDNLP